MTLQERYSVWTCQECRKRKSTLLFHVGTYTCTNCYDKYINLDKETLTKIARLKESINKVM